MKNNNKNNKKISKNAKRKDALVPSPLHFFRAGPIVQRANLAYSWQGSVTEASAGAGQIYGLSLSSIYDPDVTGAGSTAVGYSMYSNAYTRYRVIRTRVIATAQLTSGGPGVVGLMLGPNTTYSSSPMTWTVQPNSYSRALNSVTPGIMFRFDRVIDLATILGVKKQQYMTDLDFSGTFGSNPARNAYVGLFVRNFVGTTATSLWDVRLIYEVEFSQPLQSISS
jgi:hypothetical protein